jgi:hypothetical protein
MEQCGRLTDHAEGKLSPRFLGRGGDIHGCHSLLEGVAVVSLGLSVCSE